MEPFPHQYPDDHGGPPATLSLGASHAREVGVFGGISVAEAPAPRQPWPGAGFVPILLSISVPFSAPISPVSPPSDSYACATLDCLVSLQISVHFYCLTAVPKKVDLVAKDEVRRTLMSLALKLARYRSSMVEFCIF